MITRYVTKSGSVYDVCAEASEGPGSVRRVKLGDRHYARGDEHVAKRLNDAVGDGVWREFVDHIRGDVGDRLQFKFRDGEGGVITTAPVVELCEWCETEGAQLMRWFRSRTYKTGTRWAVWRWTDVDSQYIRRLHVLKTPWFAICLHWILKPDPEPYLHDHPVTFLSLILRGGYWETRVVDGKTRSGFRSWWNWIRARREDRHRIEYVRPKTLTLCLMGPKTQEWGFHTESGWIYWRDYHHAQRAAKAKTEGTR